MVGARGGGCRRLVVAADEDAQVAAVVIGVLRDVRVARTALKPAGGRPIVVGDAVGHGVGVGGLVRVA